MTTQTQQRVILSVDNAVHCLIFGASLTLGCQGFQEISASRFLLRAQRTCQREQQSLDAGDDRLSAALIKNGSLWTAHNIGVNSMGSASGSVTVMLCAGTKL
jgi:hypothetical protein